jgi:tetratricopeptide (TPR) repeat protein
MNEPPPTSSPPLCPGGRLPGGCAAGRRPLLGHFRRTLAVLFLLALIGLGGWMLWQGSLAEYHLRAGRRAVARYHNLQAQYHLQGCLRLRPREPQALLLAARVARRVGSFDLAEQFLGKYQDLADDDDLVLERVLLRAARGEVDEVSAFCRARIEANHLVAPLVREAMAAGLLQVYRLQEAEKVLREWQDRDPDNTQALLLDGTLRELRIDLSEALARYRRVVELDPEHDEARLRLVNMLVQQSNGQEALPHAEYLRRRLPGEPQVPLRLAQCQVLLGRQAEAEKTLDDLLHHQPHYAPALAERGKLALRTGETEKAETLLREAVARDPSGLDARYLLAQALRRNGKADQAWEELDALARLEEDANRIQKIVTEQMQQRPNDPALCHEVGVISLRAGAPPEGLRWLYKALALDPKHAPTHRALADHFQRTGNSTLAARHRRLAEEASRGGQ